MRTYCLYLPNKDLPNRIRVRPRAQSGCSPTRMSRLPLSMRSAYICTVYNFHAYTLRFRCLPDSGSHKVQHNLRSISHEVEDISRSKRGASHFSSDLERVPGTRSIAVEFVEAPHIVIKLLRCENTAFHFHAALFGIRSQGLCQCHSTAMLLPMSCCVCVIFTVKFSPSGHWGPTHEVSYHSRNSSAGDISTPLGS